MPLTCELIAKSECEKDRLETIIGYSPGIKPTIWTGKYPSEHNYWTEYYYTKDQNRVLMNTMPRTLFYLPRFLRKYYSGFYARNIYRSTGSSRFPPGMPLVLTRFFARSEGFKLGDEHENGLEDFYNILVKNGLTYYYNEKDLKIPKHQLNKDVVIAYTPILDNIMHFYGVNNKVVDRTLRTIDIKCYELIKSRKKSKFMIFSDHGMTDVKMRINLNSYIPHKFKLGKDYINFYDSTIAKFWFFDKKAKIEIKECLKKCKWGRLLEKEDIINYGLDFRDNRFGELLFLVKPGVEIFPNFFHNIFPERVKALHGYEPSHSDSYGVFVSNFHHNKNNRPIKIVNLLKYMLNSLNIPD